jgi:hypothetical protein
VDNIDCGVDVALVHLGGHQKLTTVSIELRQFGPLFYQLIFISHIRCSVPRPL